MGEGVGKCGKVCWGVREGEGRCGVSVGIWGKMWKSVCGERGKVYWGVGGAEERCREKYGGVGEGKRRCGRCKEVWGWCGRVYEVSAEGVRKCVEVWGI